MAAAAAAMKADKSGCFGGFTVDDTNVRMQVDKTTAGGEKVRTMTLRIGLVPDIFFANAVGVASGGGKMRLVKLEVGAPGEELQKVDVPGAAHRRWRGSPSSGTSRRRT